MLYPARGALYTSSIRQAQTLALPVSEGSSPRWFTSPYSNNIMNMIAVPDSFTQSCEYMLASAVPRPFPAFQCCTLKHWKAGKGLGTRLSTCNCTVLHTCAHAHQTSPQIFWMRRSLQIIRLGNHHWEKHKDISRKTNPCWYTKSQTINTYTSVRLLKVWAGRGCGINCLITAPQLSGAWRIICDLLWQNHA